MQTIPIVLMQSAMRQMAALNMRSRWPVRLRPWTQHTASPGAVAHRARQGLAIQTTNFPYRTSVWLLRKK